MAFVYLPYAKPTAARLICTCVNSRDFSQGQCAARYRSKTESLIPRQKPIVRRRLRSFNLLCQASIKRFLNAFGSTVQVAREPFTRSCSRRRLSSFAHRSAASVPGGAGSGTQPPSPPQEGRSRLPLCCHAGHHLLTPWMIRWGGLDGMLRVLHGFASCRKGRLVGLRSISDSRAAMFFFDVCD